MRLEVQSDTAEEIHLHGYDVFKDVEPGSSVRFHSRPSIEGVFEIETRGDAHVEIGH